MLLITRKEQESIIIDDNIEVQVVEIKGGRVKLGVSYPKGSTVYRKELFLKIKDENTSAGNINPATLNELIKAKAK